MNDLTKTVLTNKIKISDSEDEITNIVSEECAEVIQAISKCRRFGMSGVGPGSLKNNREHLEDELGDLLAIIEILVERGIVSQYHLDIAKLKKIEKLKKWSTIYEQN